MATTSRFLSGLSLLVISCWAAHHDDYVGYVPPNPQYPSLGRPISAVAEIRGVSQWSSVQGTLHFQQVSTDGPVVVRGTIKGLTAGLHGMHVHEKGNLTDECKAAGPHFNPFNKNHGHPDDKERHVGDLGNIEAIDIDHPRSQSQAHVYLVDWHISLSPASDRNILNRAVVVHNDPDDLGRGTHEDSKKTGNSGKRVACGLIVKSY